VHLNNRLTDRESETETFAPFLELLESVKNSFQQCRLDSDTKWFLSTLGFDFVRSAR
jgi:hypothetical protein